MNIKTTDKMAIALVIAMMAMQLSLTKIFAKIIPIFNHSYNPPILCALYVLMIIGVYALVFVPRIMNAEERPVKKLWAIVVEYKELAVILLLLLIAIISTDIITIVKGQLRISNIITHNLDYFYAFLSLPLVILLAESKWKWEQFVDVMLGLTAASGILRTFVSVYYSLTGIEIEIISKESAGLFWFRDNRLRVTAPCFVCLCFSLALYMFIYTKSLGKRLYYVATATILLFYCVYTWQARAGMVTIMAGTVIILLFGVMSRKQVYIRWGIVAALGVAFIAAGGLTKLIKAFSMAEDAPYLMENRGHYYAYELFFGILKENPWGYGLTEDLAIWYPNGRAQWMCDAGIMYSLVPMGPLIALFFIVMFARGVQVYLKNMKTSTLAVVALSLTAIICVGELSMDCFFTPLAFEVPMYLAIVEYIAHKGPDVHKESM